MTNVSKPVVASQSGTTMANYTAVEPPTADAAGPVGSQPIDRQRRVSGKAHVVDPRVFDEAARLIRAGWVRRQNYAYRHGKFLYCALGALNDARLMIMITDRRRMRDARDHLTDYTSLLADLIGRERHADAVATIASFNDLTAHNAEEVARLMETCAEKLRATEGSVDVA